MKWTAYQLAYLADRSPRKIVNKSRRIGFSEVVCFESACRAAGVEMWPGVAPQLVKPVPQNIFSASKDQAKKLLARIVKHLRVLEFAHNKRKLISDEGKEVVKLTNGVTLQAFSTNSRTVRGDEGDVVLDEFANVMRQDEVWKAVKPLADRNLRNPHGYQIRVVSTPLGDDNLFYEFCEGRSTKGWSYHKVPIERALAEGFVVYDDDGNVVTVDVLLEECNDDLDVFAQEYQCSFMASSMRYIARELWDGAIYVPGEDEITGRGLGIFGGMDVAAGGHESVIVDLEMNDTVLWQLAEAERKREKDWDVQEAWVGSGMRRRRKFAVDATGFGDQFGQRMENAYPGQVEGVDFTTKNKEMLTSGLKLGLSRKLVRPLATDIKLMRDVLSLKRTISKAGNVLYDGATTKKAHADGAWALALAVYAAGGAAVDRSPGRPRVHRLPGADSITGGLPRRGTIY